MAEASPMNGLKANFQELILVPWLEMRDSGIDVPLEMFLAKHAGPEKKGLSINGQAVGMKDVWYDFGLDPRVASFQDIMSTGGQGMYLAPAIVLEFVILGVEASPWWDVLCMGSVPSASKSVDAPWLKYSDEEPQETEEAETMPLAVQESGEKNVPLGKKSVGIYYSKELLLSSRLPLVKPFVMKVGHQLAAKMNRACVSAAVNGDQPGGVDSAAVIGVTTAGSVVFKDFSRVWTRGSLLYSDFDTIVTSEETANEILEIEQFIKPQGAGSATVEVDSVNRIIPEKMNHMVSSEVPVGDTLFVDAEKAMLHAVMMGVSVEVDKIVARQIEGTFASIIDGFVTVDRTQRVIMRKSLEFASNGFPVWMKPLD